MDIEISARAKPLDERNGTGLHLGAFQAGLSGEKGRNDAVNHLQYRREQIGMAGEQEASQYSLGVYPRLIILASYSYRIRAFVLSIFTGSIQNSSFLGTSTFP